MRKIVRYLLIILKSFLIFVALGAVSTATVKNFQKIMIVDEFKSKAIFEEEKSTDLVKFYRIDANEELDSYTVVGNKIIPGVEGDILVSTQATLINPLISGLVSFFAGGHAAICTNKYYDHDIYLDTDLSIESTGLNSGDNPTSIFYRDYWENDEVFKEVIGLRVKMTEKERKEIISLSSSIIGDPYNFSFLFDTVNKSYCSDLVSKVFEYIGVDLNKDDFTTSIYDLIVSNETYISYYHYFDNKGIKYIYYLD